MVQKHYFENFHLFAKFNFNEKMFDKNILTHIKIFYISYNAKLAKKLKNCQFRNIFC